MEKWNIGILGSKNRLLFHYSIIPTFHHSRLLTLKRIV